MADLLDGVAAYAKDLKSLTGRQSYFLEVLGTANTKDLSVVSFRAVERMGEPYRITIELTHRDRLSRADYLGRDASFSIVPADGSAPRVFSGCVTHFSKTKTTKDFSSYQFVVEAHIVRLNITRTSRIYQHQTAPQIIEAILRRHGFKGHQFVFRLRRQYPQRTFRFQYQIADWPYIHILMEQEGIYSYIVPGRHGDVVVFADDIDHYIYQPELKVRYRETAGMESGVEAVSALQTHVHTVPASFRVADYNPDQAWERFRAEANVASKDTTTYGQPYIYGTHHLDQDGAKWEAQLRHEAAIAWQIVYEGESNAFDLRPGRVLQMDEVLPDAPNGQVVIEVTHTGARDEAYRNTYRAIPADRRFRLKLEDSTWSKISGTLSARVTSPGDYKYAYLTQQGYYTVRFDCDFDEWNPGGESVPLRLAKPFAGKLQTGFHFPALDGDEAVLAFRDGDPDKPYISQFHHHSQAVDLITNQDRWLSRNVIRTQSNNKLRMEDWEGQESIKLSTEHSGKSQLNLGYLVDGKKEQRGEGFELRTSGHGALRAGRGLHLSAHDQPNAAGKQLDMQATIAQIESALEIARALAASAMSAKAIPADTDAQKQVKDELDGVKQPGILASAPASIGIVSGAGVQVTTQENISTAAGRNLDISVVKRFTVATGELVSVFAQKLGIKLFAAKGPVEIQAQGGAMSLLADRDVTVASVNGTVRISAKKELILECGGAFVQLKDGNITLGGPGDLFYKVITVQKQGKESQYPVLPVLPRSELSGKYSLRFATFGSNLLMQDLGWIGRSFKIVDSTGSILQAGQIGKDGRMPRTILDTPDTLTLKIGEDKWTAHQVEISHADDGLESDALKPDDNSNPFSVEEVSSPFITEDDLVKVIPENDLARASQGEG
ncbi:type VI secretion system Vgr family protein [Paraburkholderia acidicola]|uniref:type VI secretion system Vgr family protein n=1 Tax=Paraburkholderia acidicola TaxID=1912599 RepID=UPI000BBC7843|nr:type VI secretion system Vgr family protein [Paraburkholderia acidicola]